MRRVLLVTAVVALLALGMAVQAATITSTFTGTGSGTLAGTPFPASPFSITTVGDTVQRQHYPTQTAYVIANTSASITIQGLGSFAFVTPTETFCNYSVPAVGLSRQVTHEDLFDIGPEPTLAGWEMLTSIGPINSQTGWLGQWLSSAVQTSGGTLYFADADGIPATFTAVVPEPSSIMALAGSLVGLLGMRRRLRR